MNTSEKKQVIAEMIKAKRPDLANVVANVVKAAPPADWEATAIRILKAIVPGIFKGEAKSIDRFFVSDGIKIRTEEGSWYFAPGYEPGVMGDYTPRGGATVSEEIPLKKIDKSSIGKAVSELRAVLLQKGGLPSAAAKADKR